MVRFKNIQPYVYNEEWWILREAAFKPFPYPEGEYGINPIPKIGGTYTESYDTIPIVALSDSITFNP